MPSHRRRRETPDVPATPAFPEVTGAVTPSAVLPLLDDALAWPASRRLASVATARVTRPQPLLGQTPSTVFR